jgi:hypothetical protein
MGKYANSYGQKVGKECDSGPEIFGGSFF